MEIKWHKISVDEPFFIAEAGVNHNGKIEMAKSLIDTAVNAGADAVKFQSFNVEELVTTSASKANYQENTTGEGSQYEMLCQYELDRADHEQLVEYCTEQGITFLSTPFDCESADMLAELGVPAMKVGSGELDNHPLLKHIAGLGLPMIVSTGMGTMEEVHTAYDIITSVDTDLDIVFLHCTSDYPAAVEDVHLRAMETMADELPVPIGYSDHTTLPETPALAVAAGACVVEKHFTIDSSLPGPDHEASLEPDELERAVELVEVAARALGTAEKAPTDSELENRLVARKSLHAAKDIEAGKTLSDQDIKIIRPANGISPSEYLDVLGKQTRCSISEGEPIDRDKLSEDADSAES